jgi:glycosyltransferase involved in cell wall biosynthesis
LSVVITTYRRAWALPYSLSSLVDQTSCPDEVIIVLKPSGDGSEQIIEKFSPKLPIETIIQREGFIVDAVQLGIDNVSGDTILFIDDDAIAEINFIAKYKKFFDRFKGAGGATGIVFRAYLEKGHLVKTTEPFTPFNVARPVPYRKPLKVFEKYSGWVSKSGLSTTTVIEGGDIVLSALLSGANMGFIRKAIEGCPLDQLYKRSRKGFNYESLLAYYARIKGFHTYKLISPVKAPIVWHLTHQNHLTLRNNFWSEFWCSYDIFKNYFRYKKLGADVSFLSWVKASVALLRKRTPVRTLALLYTILDFPNATNLYALGHC